jgi:hypothetical protein
MSGKKSKVIQFPINTRSRIVCQYSKGTTTEPFPSRKGNRLVEYYKKEWPAVVGALLGTSIMFLTVYFAALTIYGDK